MRVNLSLSGTLADKIQKEADLRQLSPNEFIVEKLSEIYLGKSSTNEVNIKTLVGEAHERAKLDNPEFVLADLPSFRKISMAMLADGTIKPSSARARLGMQFNRYIRQHGKEVNISRVYKDGKPFNTTAAVYRVETEKG